MRTSLFVFTFFIFSGLSAIYSQSLGFLETECNVEECGSYHYENYTYGSHGHGYRLYHYSTKILEKSFDLGLCEGTYLKCIDDSTSFFADFDYMGYYLYKLTGYNTNSIDGAYGVVASTFILNAYIIIVVSDNYGKISIHNASDIPGWYHDLIYNPFVNKDTTLYDTIIGKSFCPALEELNYRYFNSNDTINYKIIITVDDPAFSLNEKEQTNWYVLPNPFKDYLSVVSGSIVKFDQIDVYNLYGVLIQSIPFSGSLEQRIYVGNLTKGIYFIKIRDGNMNSVRKVIKF